MCALQITPVSSTMNAMVNAHARSGDIAGMEELLRVMRKEEIKLSIDTLNTVISLRAQGGDLAGAYILLRDMKEEFRKAPSTLTIATLMHSHSQAGTKPGKETKIIYIYK